MKKKIHLRRNRFTTFCGKRIKDLKKNHILVAGRNKGVSCKSCKKSLESSLSDAHRIYERLLIRS